MFHRSIYIFLLIVSSLFRNFNRSAGCFQSNQGGEGEVSPRKSVVQSACQYDVTSRVSDFQNGNKVFFEETDKNFEFITELTVLDLEILRFLLS